MSVGEASSSTPHRRETTKDFSTTAPSSTPPLLKKYKASKECKEWVKNINMCIETCKNVEECYQKCNIFIYCNNKEIK